MTNEPLDPLWLDRARAIGAARSRYLWLLLIGALFFAGLRLQLDPQRPSTHLLKIPIVDVEMSVWTVLASGPLVLSFFVMAINGSMRAYRRAMQKLGLGDGADWRDEAVDTHPNAIDLAMYTTPKSNKVLATLAYSSYPLFLTAALAEAIWLWCGLLDWQPLATAWLFFVIAGIATWLFAAVQVGLSWAKRIPKLTTLWQTRNA